MTKHDVEREKLAAELSKYLAGGGKVKQVPAGRHGRRKYRPEPESHRLLMIHQADWLADPLLDWDDE